MLLFAASRTATAFYFILLGCCSQQSRKRCCYLCHNEMILHNGREITPDGDKFTRPPRNLVREIWYKGPKRLLVFRDGFVFPLVGRYQPENAHGLEPKHRYQEQVTLEPCRLRRARSASWLLRYSYCRCAHTL